MLVNEIPFLNAIFQTPGDSATHLIYADWLDERGDNDRAQYLRLAIELSQLAKSAQKHRGVKKQIRTVCERIDATWLKRVRCVQDQHTDVRRELYILRDGRGLIEVKGGSQETALLVEGKAVALNWDDCAGSIGQYLVMTGHQGSQEFLWRLREFVAGPFDTGCRMSEQLMPLLSLFVPGVYCLTFEPGSAVTDVGVTAQPVGNVALQNYYPYGRNLIPTQTRDSLREERVSHYRIRIMRGKAHVVVTTCAEGAWCEFIIDGHHKLAAYENFNSRPALLCIERWDAPGVGVKEGIGFLPAGHPGIIEYRRMKRRIRWQK